MLEDHLYWVLLSYGFVHKKGSLMKATSAPLPVPGFMQGFALNMMTKKLSSAAHAQGIGRHSQEEVERLGVDDLKAVSDFLGDKQFMFGKEPTELDACLFGFLSMILYGDPEDENALIKALNEDLGNLKRFHDRMKEKFWADWDDNLYKEPEKPSKAKKDGDKKEDGEDKEGEDNADGAINVNNNYGLGGGDFVQLVNLMLPFSVPQSLWSAIFVPGFGTKFWMMISCICPYS